MRRSVRVRGWSARVLALVVVLITLTSTWAVVGSRPTGAAPTTPPPADSIVVPYGNVPRFCVDGEPGATSPYGTHLGVAWSPVTQRWVSVPICTFRWGYISLSTAAQVIRAGGVATFSLTDSAAAPYIPTLGGAYWAGFSAGQVVSGCTWYDISCSIRVGVEGQDPPEWTYQEIHLSAPSAFVTWLPQFGCTEATPCPYTTTNVWGTVVVSPAPSAGPTASFEAQVEPNGRATLSSSSSDPDGDELTHEWDFGDGRSASQDRTVIVEYERPGTYTVGLTVRNERTGRSDTTTREIELPAPTLTLTIELPDGLDALAPANRVVQVDEPIVVAVTVERSAEGVGALEGVRFGADNLLEVGGGTATVSSPEPVPPPGGFTLEPGGPQRFLVEIRPSSTGELVLAGQVTGSDSAGRPVHASAEARLTVATPLSVDVTADPARLERPGPFEDAAVQHEFMVTVRVRNTGSVELAAASVVSIGSPGWDHVVGWVGEADNPGPWTLAPGEEATTRFQMRASEVHPFELVAEAQATLPAGAVVAASGRTSLQVTDPQPLLLEVVSVPASSPVSSTFPVQIMVANPSDAIGPVEGVAVNLRSDDGAHAEVVELPSGPDSTFSLEPGEFRFVTAQMSVTDRGLSSIEAVAWGRRRGLLVSGARTFETIARVPTSISVTGVRRRTADEIAPGTDDQSFPWLVATRLPSPGSCTGLDVSFTVVRDGDAVPARALPDDHGSCRFLVPVPDLASFDLSASIVVTQELRSGPRTVEIGSAMARIRPADLLDDDEGVITTTTAAAVAGDRRVEIASNVGWGSGDYARLYAAGGAVVRRVSGVGSLIFDAPLPVDLPEGTLVEKVDAPFGDVAPPSVTSPGGVLTVGSTAVVEFSCDDGEGVGVEACIGSVEQGTIVDTTRPGTFEVTIDTWDRNGNAQTVRTRFEITPGIVTVPGPGGTTVAPVTSVASIPGASGPVAGGTVADTPTPVASIPGASAPPTVGIGPTGSAMPALPATGAGLRPALLAFVLVVTGIAMIWPARRRSSGDRIR